MKKLYRAIETRVTFFIYDSEKDLNPPAGLMEEARCYLKSEAEFNLIPDEDIEIIECTDIDQIPENWNNGFIWAPDQNEEQMTPREFLLRTFK